MIPCAPCISHGQTRHVSRNAKQIRLIPSGALFATVGMTVSGSQRQQMATADYLPLTFVERGAIIPFTTPILSQARARSQSDAPKIEFALPAITQSQSILVAPDEMLSDLGTLSVYDRELRRLIGVTNLVTPERVQLAALNISATGLAGPLAQEAARKTLERMEQNENRTREQLMAAVLRALGEEAKTPGDRPGLAAAMRAAAERVDLSAQELEERVAQLAEALGLVGLAASQDRSILRDRLAALVKFEENVTAWADAVLLDIAPEARHAGNRAAQVIELATRCLGDLDAKIGNPVGLLASWPSGLKEVQKLAARLSWLLDGWPHVVKVWRDALAGTSADQAHAIAEIMALMPPLPKGEKAAGDPHASPKSQHMLRVFHNWRTEQAELDLMLRMERLNAAQPA
jgi:hypothetical protein